MLRTRHSLHNLGPEGGTGVGHEEEGEEEEGGEWGKVSRAGSHDVPQSRGALGLLGETLGRRTLLGEERMTQFKLLDEYFLS